jgi:dolichyl-diphosphooligosaccharide--protein glycosyltransferase
MSWYPLGRPVGSTIYPGMQFTAVWIKEYILTSWSINDVCCYIPAWFGGFATILTGAIAYECVIPENCILNPYKIFMHVVRGGEIDDSTAVIPSHRKLPFGIVSPALECAMFTMAIMSVVPAHLMRSVGGGYDNESVAMTAMTMTFYFWIRSLRNDGSAWLGALAGLAYFYMVASWGGYIFVLNMVGIHAAMLVLMGRFSNKVYIAYTLFYAIGTTLAIQIPVVGWTPLKSLEQLGPLVVFLGYQGLQVCEVIRKKYKMNRSQAFKLRFQLGGAALAILIVLVMLIVPSGYFGPLSSRVRGLFVQHTKTGNPLVDSVAEHQKASNKAYFQYLHHICLLAPLGYLLTFFNLSDASSFLVAWGLVTYYFSNKMVRLLLLTAPIGSVLGGILAGRVVSWSVRQLWDATQDPADQSDGEDVPMATPVAKDDDSNGVTKQKKGRKPKKSTTQQSKRSSSSPSISAGPFDSAKTAFTSALASKEGVIVKRTVAALILILTYMMGQSFKNYSWRLSGDLSHPSIIMRARTRAGKDIKVDDYREAYWWLRDNTPEDSRILAWWDYGYQITAIANRTTMADGNTWNHEHIALLGKCLTTDLIEGHEIARQLADYVLIWGGGGGDDLAKSPHLARIANSVYRDHCPPDDTTCRAFGFIDRQGTPSPMMQRSLLFQLHGHGLKEGVSVSNKLFTETFRSKYGKVRVYKIENVDMESRSWAADTSNRICDVPGSWYCPGQYPPGLANILARKKDFAQLGDFNKKDGSDEEYQKRYFEALKDPSNAAHQAIQADARRSSQKTAAEETKTKKISYSVSTDGTSTRSDEDRVFKRPNQETIDRVNKDWKNTDTTTALWSLISQNRMKELKDWLYTDPPIAFTRSEDGRGPMWWAYEQRNQEVVKFLKKIGVPDTEKDSNGKTPVDLLQMGQEL